MPLYIWVLVLSAAFASAQSSSPSGNVTLAWDPSPDPTVIAYRIYFGTQSGSYAKTIDLQNVTQATVTDLSPGTTYFFSATAVSDDGLESDFSNEVAYTVASTVPYPSKWVTPTLALQGDASTGLRLNGSGVPGATYTIVTSTNGSDWSSFSTAVADFNGAFSVYVGQVGPNLRPGVTYYFGLAGSFEPGAAVSAKVTYTVPYAWNMPSLALGGDATTGLILNGGGSPWGMYRILASTNHIDWTPFATAAADGSGSFAIYVGKPGQALTPGLTYYYGIALYTDGSGSSAGFYSEVAYTVPYRISSVTPTLALQGDASTGLRLNGSGVPGATYAIVTSTNGGDWSSFSTAVADFNGAFSVYVGQVGPNLRPGATYYFGLAGSFEPGAAVSAKVAYTVPYAWNMPSLALGGDATTGLILNGGGSPWGMYRILASTNHIDWTPFATAAADGSGSFAIYVGKPGQALTPGLTYYYGIALYTDGSGSSAGFYSEVAYTVPYPTSIKVTFNWVIGIILNCRAAPGGTYDVLSSTDQSNWTVLGRATADEQGAFAFFAGKPSGASQVYRLEPVVK